MQMHEDRALLDAVRTIKARLPTCLNCFNFDEKEETCEIAGNARPPARVIAFGCPAFDPCPF